MSDKRVRPLELDELHLVIDYFHSASRELLVIMGVEPARLWPKDVWLEALQADFAKPLREREYFYLGWEFDGTLIGHSNINHITFGSHANIHLHIWDDSHRERGMGPWFFKQSVNYFLREFQLQKLLCEPCADNPAPNRTLQRLGLSPVKTYRTTPGPINVKDQLVTLYEIMTPFEE